MMIVQKGGTVDLVEVEEVHKVQYLRPWSIKKLPGLPRRYGKGQRCRSPCEVWLQCRMLWW